MIDTQTSAEFSGQSGQNIIYLEVNAKPVCLICNQHVAVLKEYNIRRHYDTQHKDKYKDSISFTVQLA